MKQRSEYRHPKHDEIAAILLTGANDATVYNTLKVDRRAVTRIRDILGLGRSRGNRTSEQDKVDRFSVLLFDGHTRWTGRTATSGAPVIRQNGVEIPAAHVAFQRRTGRKPVGIVKPECGFPDCLTPGHVGDELERREIRMQERALHGLDPAGWDICPKGKHSWNESGRLEPDLTPYCKDCNTERARRVRQAKKEEAGS